MSKNSSNRRERLRFVLLRLSRSKKSLVTLTFDVSATILGLLLSIFLTLGSFPAEIPYLILLPAAAIVAVVSALTFGLYRSMIRYVGVDVLSAIALTSGATACCVVLLLSDSLGFVPAARIAIVHFCLHVLSVMGGRVVARLFLNRRSLHREPVIIYGAGNGGVRLATALSNSPRFTPIAFIDDNARFRNVRIDGIDVYEPHCLEQLIHDTRVRRLLLAMPSASRQRRREIIERLAALPVRVQTIPDVGDIVSGTARVDDIQDVSVEDLLGRDPVPPHPTLLRQKNTGKVVLVTGAGGSIGSELCRKILEVGPRQLLLIERSEIALYRLEKLLLEDIESQSLDTAIVAMLGSVQDKQRMLEVMKTFSVDTVYHTAAYKHVPIVEHNMLEGIANNVFGTLHTAQAAIEAEVDTFVLVSTDKAVSPTNVMGASKRLAELVLQGLDKESRRTKFCMVRFGNVLASSGSVVPLFRDQIRAGGPVTVTHPEITRYFMTIPEAAQLVIQAGAMAKGGDVFVLDMGKPVKIVDLAEKMIQLMGKTVRSKVNPSGEIEIAYTGLRPAEKLYEELLIGTNVTGTSHPRIMRANEGCLEQNEMAEVLASLTHLLDVRDWNGLREIMLRVVEGYKPTGSIEDHVFLRNTAVAEESNVADLELYRKQDGT